MPVHEATAGAEAPAISRVRMRRVVRVTSEGSSTKVETASVEASVLSIGRTTNEDQARGRRGSIRVVRLSIFDARVLTAQAIHNGRVGERRRVAQGTS